MNDMPEAASRAKKSATSRLSCVSAICLAAACLVQCACAGDILLNSTSVREHQSTGTIVGIFKSVDISGAGPWTNSLVSGTGADDNGLFSTSGDTLRTAASLDYATQNTFSIRVRTQNSTGSFFEKPFTITV